MRSAWLVILFGLWTILALTPAVAWSFAVTFDFIDDGFRDWLGASATTIPLALALGALTLVVHGMKQNAAFQDEAAEELEELQAQMLAAQAASLHASEADASGAAGAQGRGATVTAPKGEIKTSRTDMASAHQPKSRASPKNRVKRRGMSMARRQIRRRTGF